MLAGGWLYDALAWLLLGAAVGLGGWILARPDRFRFRGSVFVGFLLLTIGMTSPLALFPSRMMLVAGAGEDAFIGVWNLWWTRFAIERGMNPFETDWLFHPNGTNLALHTLAFTYAAVSLPLQWILPSPDSTGPAPLFVVYNLLLLASFTLTGWATYRLAWLETGHRTASILAGILFGFVNYRFANTVRLHVIATELLVLALWAWVALLRRPAPVRLFPLAGALVLLVLASLEYAAYAALLFLVPAIPALARRRRGAFTQAGRGADVTARQGADATARRPAGPSPHHGRGAWMVAAAGAAGGAAILLLPFFTKLAARLAEGTARFDPRLGVFFSADLLDAFIPNPRHPLWGRLFAPVTERFHQGDAGFGMSIGWIPIGLLVVSAMVLFRVRRHRRWFWGFVAFWVLSLGPLLHVAGTITAIPLPQRWLAELGGPRTPIRYFAPAGICLALAIAGGWAELRRRQGFADRDRPHRLELVAGGLLLFELLAAPLPLARVPVPETMRRVAHEDRAHTLLPVPGLPARESLLYQTIHRQRLAHDVSSAIPLRSPRGVDPFTMPHWGVLTQGLGRPAWLESLPLEERSRMAADLRAFLRRYAIRWIVVYGGRPALAPDGRAFEQTPVLDPESYASFREEMRRLGSISETEFGGATLFEFDVEGTE